MLIGLQRVLEESSPEMLIELQRVLEETFSCFRRDWSSRKKKQQSLRGGQGMSVEGRVGKAGKGSRWSWEETEGRRRGSWKSSMWSSWETRTISLIVRGESHGVGCWTKKKDLMLLRLYIVSFPFLDKIKKTKKKVFHEIIISGKLCRQ